MAGKGQLLGHFLVWEPVLVAAVATATASGALRRGVVHACIVMRRLLILLLMAIASVDVVEWRSGRAQLQKLLLIMAWRVFPAVLAR